MDESRTMNFQNLHSFEHYGYALVGIVGTYIAAATVMARRGAAFINMIGVLFSLTLAFIANDTWNAHERATNAVFREADFMFARQKAPESFFSNRALPA